MAPNADKPRWRQQQRPSGRATSYGALTLGHADGGCEDERYNGVSRREWGQNARLALGLMVVSMVSVVAFRFGVGMGEAQTEMVDLSAAEVVNMKFKGDELVKTGKDGWCDTPCKQPYTYFDAIAGEEITTPYGYCNAAAACLGLPEGCMGIDYRLSKVLEEGGVPMIACAGVQGAYDCGEAWPCQNGGFCIDGYEGKTCICPFGWEGETCQHDINECAPNPDATPSGVCHAQGVCDNTPPGAYSCSCLPGFMGDGYAYDQSKVKYYSVLDTDYSYGWLHREETKADGSPLDDSNEDGLVDQWGCTDINDCASNPCFHGGRCYDLWDGAYTDELTGKLMHDTTGEFLGPTAEAWACDCRVQLPIIRWVGERCDEDVDECTDGLNNCDVHASCDNVDGSFKCTCNEFWEGDGFEPTTDPVDYNCLESNYCDSARGYSGCTDILDCNVIMSLGVDADLDGLEDVVIKTPCKHGGTCAEDGLGTGKYICTCVEGWDQTGDAHGYTPDDQNCGADIDECEIHGQGAEFLGCDIHAHCHNTDGSWLCLCNNGWTGIGDIDGGCYDADDCEFSPCQHGGTCYDCGTLCLICDCIVGWRGKTCEIDWNECRMGIHTCHDFAICINTPGSFECECEPGYSGDGYRKCNAIDDCIRWEDNKETGGPDDINTHDFGDIRYNPDGTIREETQEIRPAPWVDDMQIIVPVNGEMKNVHQCGEWEPMTRIWKEHGTCTDTGDASFLCVCHEGWSDSNCDRDINECSRNTDMCHKYGTCHNTDGSYYCACNTGYTGDGVIQCHDVDDCTFGPERCYAGRCTDLGAGDFRCVCLEGYMDRLCDRDIDECAIFTHTCQPEKVTEEGRIIPGAICKNTPGSWKCSCRDGFDGDGIGPEGCTDVDDCGSAPCENGTCQDNGQSSYSCTCDYGWVNTNCDFDFNECITGAHDCHPEGKCVNTPGGYYCRCVSGHTGDGYTCTDLDDCDPDPCDPVHGTCNDNGANKYVCHCSIGFGGMGCEQDEVECMIGTHGCHANADCFNTYGSHICICKQEFYGDGKECAPCTDCLLPCSDNEDFTICPGHDDYNGDHDVAHVMDHPEFCPTTHSCGHGPGYKVDRRFPPCAAVDRTCIQLNECELMTSDCHPERAKCTDTEGSFLCECLIGTFGGKQYWGDGRTCEDCTICGLGERMVDDCTSTSDRICRQTVYDGNYAIETYSGDTAQCLVHWKDTGKIFPERYAWGGRLGTPLGQGMTQNGYDTGGLGSESVGKYEMWGGGDDGLDDKQHLVPSPDLCAGKNEPICGVCDYNGRSPAENIVMGMEAVWTFMHLEDQIYLILNGADGEGFRCLGFQLPSAPYPSLITWQFTSMMEDEGTCMHVANNTEVAVEPHTQCKETADCLAIAESDAVCVRQSKEAGEWRQNLKGVPLEDLTLCDRQKEMPPLDERGDHARSIRTKNYMKHNRAECPLNYFCGFEDSSVGSAKSKLIANGATVWNVHPLACQGLMCHTRWTEEQYLIRSLVSMDANMDNVVDQGDYRCLYFPEGIGGIPKMVPRAASENGIWLGAGKNADADANGDPECGIALRDESAEDQNLRFNGGGNKQIEGGTVHTGPKPTQEKELLINKQAVFHLIKLPDF